MAESAFPSFVIPGTYVRVLSEGLIRASGFSVGNVGIVGTASAGIGETRLLSSYKEGRDAFGNYDAFIDAGKKLNLSRSLELLYQAGAGTVFARALGQDDGADLAEFKSAFEEL